VKTAYSVNSDRKARRVPTASVRRSSYTEQKQKSLLTAHVTNLTHAEPQENALRYACGWLLDEKYVV
jgi:hypothetical protein